MAKLTAQRARAFLARMRGGRLHRAARHVAGGAKGSAFSAATGGAFYFAEKYALANIDYLKNHPDSYLPGIATGAAGHFLKRKQADVGAALLGVSGYMLARQYDTNNPSGTTATVTAPAAKGLDGGDSGELLGSPGAMGWDDFNTGALDNTMTDASPGTDIGPGSAAGWLDGGNAGALVDSGDYEEATALSDLY
jgi:hypothetical protein